MCGIAGIVGRPPEDPGVIERMTESLAHRGPDDRGVWHSERAHIGHTRLSILDLSDAGHQPMRLDDLVLTYNGEIYNFRLVRDGLPGPFHSETDSEVVLHAYRENGPACVHDLRGMFAFAIWDDRRQRLFAGRDRLGIKPLYYRPFDGGLAFSSEVVPLLELGPLPIDDGAIADYLTFGHIPTPKSAWRGIFKLGAGETLTWERGNLTIERYWRPEPGEPSAGTATGASDVSATSISATSISATAAIEELDALLGDVVPDHLLADVPVGVFLSGGLDSATVAAYAGRCSTFTLGQREAKRDEAPAARSVARHLGTDHHEEIAAIPDLATAADTIADVFGEPFGDTGAMAVWMISKLTVGHVKVALAGEGGDEIFGGYRWYGQSMTSPSNLGLRFMAGLLPTLSRGGRAFQRRAATGFERYCAFLGVFSPTQRRALLGSRFDTAGEDDPYWHLRRYWRPDLPLRERIRLTDLQAWLADGLLVKADRSSMAHSLEVRPPLLDHRLVEWGLARPVTVARHPDNDQGKWLLRRLMEPRLPEGHLDLPKRGFNLAMRRWAKENPGVVRDAVGRLRTHGVIRKPLYFELNNEQIWSLLVLDRWYLRHDAGYQRAA